MKNLTQVLFALFCLCMPALLHAQRDDSKYLAGAVPEADGKVVFTKDFSIPGMSQDTIYSRLLKWMDTRLAKNENTSRVVYSDREKGQIVGMGTPRELLTEKFIYDMYEVRCRVDEEKSTGRINIVYLPQHWM